LTLEHAAQHAGNVPNDAITDLAELLKTAFTSSNVTGPFLDNTEAML
jgi:hypothetical protein